MRRKKVHLEPGRESLEVLCLRDGSLDVSLSTGVVYGIQRGRRVMKRLNEDKDGYLGFFLNREKGERRGKPIRERLRNGTERLRFRHRRYVLVNRLVKIKAIAVGKGGRNWRQFVADLPRGVDVNHLAARNDNRARLLELSTERANRGRTELHDEELEQLRAAF
jgi:hypothetical protein